VGSGTFPGPRSGEGNKVPERAVGSRRSEAALSDSSVRIGPSVCGSDHQCADSAHLTHSPGRDPPRSRFHTRETKDDGKSAITTSRFPFLKDRARPACRWARELPLTHPVHDRLKPSRLATGRWVKAMAATACVESRRRDFGSWNESGGRTTGTLSPPGCRRLRRWKGKILCCAGRASALSRPAAPHPSKAPSTILVPSARSFLLHGNPG